MLENYGGWRARAAKRSQQPRDYLLLEFVTGKKFISPYSDKELFISAANLDYEATIKNAYKLPQLDLLEETGRNTSNMKKHVFNKGSASNIQGGDKWRDTNISGMAFPNNGPGLYIHENNILEISETLSLQFSCRVYRLSPPYIYCRNGR